MTCSDGDSNERDRRRRLIDVQSIALRLLDRIENLRLLAPGRTEREIERDICALAQNEFHIEKYWHKRIVRAGVNTLSVAEDNPPVRTIEEDDLVFVDLGPIFGDWEADVGRSYAIGHDPRKQALCRDLLLYFELVKHRFLDERDITGAELYTYACEVASAGGWLFGGKIAGHVIGEFPHARLPGARELNLIGPQNPERLRCLDANGHIRHWILEIHLVDPSRKFAGFYERLMLDHLGDA
ncbi:M24 family metallopeptidase [Methylosinus sporium]|uniref:M24 family metallopeptidase n=1 Tax=Methylosinus sporium TaxID=428 RepID=UPI00132FCF89|nr:M24 family metallopeptidase [Methylosinus sporium]